MDNHTTNRPLIIAFASGKGGVGKTMLAVAAGVELSHVRRILILDIDFFNRGLTGLFIRGKNLQEVSSPEFLDLNGNHNWLAKQVSDNLYTVSFPDIGYIYSVEITPKAVADLATRLENWIMALSETLKCDAVVLDCHGGPDALSFAAVKLADKCLLVSEPDRITMYGTLHFLRQLSAVEVPGENVHLIFNKVTGSVGATFLWRAYNTLLIEYFSGKPLLAAFPLEMYLTKSFEEGPLVIEEYPHSMLARKTQVMLFDLLWPHHRGFISQRASRVPSWLRNWRRRSFGRVPMLFSVNFMAAIGFVLLLVFAAIQVPMDEYSSQGRALRNIIQLIDNRTEALTDFTAQIESLENRADPFQEWRWRQGNTQFLERLRSYLDDLPDTLPEIALDVQALKADTDSIEAERGDVMETRPLLSNVTARLATIRGKLDVARADISKKRAAVREIVDTWEKLVLTWAAFAAAALTLSWTNYLDTECTHRAMNRRWLSATFYLAVLMALWMVVTTFLSLQALEIFPSVWNLFDWEALFLATLLGLLFCLSFLIWVRQAYQAYHDLRYSSHRASATGRGICALAALCGPGIVMMLHQLQWIGD